MSAISSKEFITNQKKYFDMALDREVLVKRGKNKFIISNANPYEEFLEPDDDFRRAITMDELRRRVKEDIHKWFSEKNESNSIT